MLQAVHRDLLYQAVTAFKGLCQMWLHVEEVRAGARKRREGEAASASWIHGYGEMEDDDYDAAYEILFERFEDACGAVSKMRMAVTHDFELHARLQALVGLLFFTEDVGPWSIEGAFGCLVTMVAFAPVKHRQWRIPQYNVSLPDKDIWIDMAFLATMHREPWLAKEVASRLDDDDALGRAMATRLAGVLAEQRSRVMPCPPNGMQGIYAADEGALACALSVVELYAHHSSEAAHPFGQRLLASATPAELPVVVTKLQRLGEARSDAALAAHFGCIVLRQALRSDGKIDLAAADLAFVLRQTRIASTRPLTRSDDAFARVLATLESMVEADISIAGLVKRCMGPSIAIAVAWLNRHAAAFPYDPVPALEAIAVAIKFDAGRIVCARPNCAAESVRSACSRCGWVVRCSAAQLA